MRRFFSYGPVNARHHFTVPREELIRDCLESIIGDAEEGGHYFTIWAPRQTGKTWLVRQVKNEIENRHGDRFLVGSMSVQGIIMDPDDPEDKFLGKIPHLMWETFDIKDMAAPRDWEHVKEMFAKTGGMFDRPVILFIDEFDSLPPKVIDRLVTLFRDMYLKRENYLIHGLALIGVRAVLGVESLRGSPFNVQRSLHVQNFNRDEVNDLFRQYVEESGQEIDDAVVHSLYESTRGQPGLVGWFGELLTEKHNPGNGRLIDNDTWGKVCHLAKNVEMNNTVLNLVKKACSEEYRPHVLKLFTRADVPFQTDKEWCNYLYLNGIIDIDTVPGGEGKWSTVCRFSSPFVQYRLYKALTGDLVGDDMPILALDPLDELTDIFEKDELNLPALLQRYKDYLGRLKAKGLNPWKDQPRRTDLRLTEAVGHFHLYAWLLQAVGRRCAVSPEFPTGNGKVDLHLRCDEKEGIIEVKSFRDASEAKAARTQAARYATQTGLESVTLALFVPTSDAKVLDKLSGNQVVEKVRVSVFAIGWE